MPAIHGRLIAYPGSATEVTAWPMMGTALAMANRIRCGPPTRLRVAPANGIMPTSVRPTAAFASSGSPRRSNALRARMDPAAKSAPSKRGGLGLRLRTYSAARYALRPMRNAARTSPPAISAVIRLRTGAVGRAFVRGLRAGVLGRVRTFGDSGGAIVACLDVSGLIVTGGESPEGAGLVSGRCGAGFGRTGGRVGGSEDSGLSAGRGGAGLGGVIVVFTGASGGFGLATTGAAGGRGTSVTGGLRS